MDDDSGYSPLMEPPRSFFTQGFFLVPFSKEAAALVALQRAKMCQGAGWSMVVTASINWDGKWWNINEQDI